MMSDREFLCLTAPREVLASVLRGKGLERAIPLSHSRLPRLSPREALVIWQKHSPRPCIVGTSDEDRQELFNWLLTFHRDLSPLSSWCHVVSLDEIERFRSGGRSYADLAGFEAAWAGAAIAEAMVLSGRSFDSVTLASCLATETFAIGRTAALYGARSAASDVSERIAEIRAMLGRRAERWHPTSLTIEVLLRLLPEPFSAQSALIDLFAEACRSLIASNEKEPSIHPRVVQRIIDRVPMLAGLELLGDLSAEDRVKFLRQIRQIATSPIKGEDRAVLCFAAGYIVSRIGGAEQDLRLAETFEELYGDVLTWGAVLGGLGAEAYWTDAFNGMGRLVARELVRSFQVFDPPSADIAADELLVIEADQNGSSKFRTANRTAAAISLKPGVVFQVSLADGERTKQKSFEKVPSSARGASPDVPNWVILDSRTLQKLAEELFPYMRKLFQADSSRSRKGRRQAPELPLNRD